MEQLLHYCWKHRLYPIAGLRTTGGDEVVDCGIPHKQKTDDRPQNDNSVEQPDIVAKAGKN